MYVEDGKDASVSDSVLNKGGKIPFIACETFTTFNTATGIFGL